MRATDGDAGDNSTLTYTVEDVTARLYFEVNILFIYSGIHEDKE